MVVQPCIYLATLPLLLLVLFDSSVFCQNYTMATGSSQLVQGLPASSRVEEDKVEKVRHSSRVTNPTNKGLEYQIYTKRNNFKSAVNAWRRNAFKTERLLIDGDVIALRDQMRVLEDDIGKVMSAYEALTALCDVHSDDHGKFENIQSEHHTLLKKLSDAIRELEIDMTSIKSSVASSKGNVKSKKSGSSHSSKASCLSNSSASKKLEYATKAAALKTELKYIDIYPELQRIQTQKVLEINEEQLKAVEKIEQEDHGVRFEQESVKQHLDTLARDETHDHLDRYFKSQTIAAKLSTPTTNVSWLSRYAPVTPTLASVVQSCGVTAAGQNPGGLNPGISGVCSTGAPTSVPPLSDLNPNVPEFRPAVSHSGSLPNTLTKPTWVHTESVATGSQLPVFSSCAPHRSILHDGHNMPHVTTQQPAQNSSMQMLGFAKLFSSHMDLSRLPVPESPVFSGDPLKYPDWKVTSETLIDRRAIAPSQKIPQWCCSRSS